MRHPEKLRLPSEQIRSDGCDLRPDRRIESADAGLGDESLTEYTVFPLEGNVASSVRIVGCMVSKVWFH